MGGHFFVDGYTMRVPRGTETPVSRRMDHCGVSWAGSTSSSSLRSRMQRRWPWGLSPETCIGKHGQVLAAALPGWWCSHCPLSLTPLHSLWECHNSAPQ